MIIARLPGEELLKRRKKSGAVGSQLDVSHKGTYDDGNPERLDYNQSGLVIETHRNSSEADCKDRWLSQLHYSYQGWEFCPASMDFSVTPRCCPPHYPNCPASPRRSQCRQLLDR